MIRQGNAAVYTKYTRAKTWVGPPNECPMKRACNILRLLLDELGWKILSLEMEILMEATWYLYRPNHEC